MNVSRTSPFGEKFRVHKVVRTSIVKTADVFSGPEGCKFCLLRRYFLWWREGPKSLVTMGKGEQIVMQGKMMRRTESSRTNICFTPKPSIIYVLHD